MRPLALFWAQSVHPHLEATWSYKCLWVFTFKGVCVWSLQEGERGKSVTGNKFPNKGKRGSSKARFFFFGLSFDPFFALGLRCHFLLNRQQRLLKWMSIEHSSNDSLCNRKERNIIYDVSLSHACKHKKLTGGYPVYVGSVFWPCLYNFRESDNVGERMWRKKALVKHVSCSQALAVGDPFLAGDKRQTCVPLIRPLPPKTSKYKSQHLERFNKSEHSE